MLAYRDRQARAESTKTNKQINRNPDIMGGTPVFLEGRPHRDRRGTGGRNASKGVEEASATVYHFGC